MNFEKMNSQNHPQQPFKNSIRALAPYALSSLIVLILIVALLIFRPEILRIVGNNALDNFDSMIVSNGYHNISLADGRSWEVSYEKNNSHTYAGTVRHVSLIRSGDYAILSHDILVTSGDFQNPGLVTTYVANHHFTWQSRTVNQPQGAINLLHTLPMNQMVYEALKKIKTGDTVIIQGYEIFRINAWNASHQPIGYWKDSGCNTILVTTVTIEDLVRGHQESFPP